MSIFKFAYLYLYQYFVIKLSFHYGYFCSGHVILTMAVILYSSGMSLERCKGSRKKRTCVTDRQKWSYAFPLEIIYLTPLNQWNPYKLEYKGKFNSEEGKTVKRHKSKYWYPSDQGFLYRIYRMRESLIRTDPVGMMNCWAQAIKRRKCQVKSPLGLWHINGNHKLIRYSVYLILSYCT